MKLTLTPETKDEKHPMPTVSIEVQDRHAETMPDILENLIIPALKAQGYTESVFQIYFNMGAIENQILGTN